MIRIVSQGVVNSIKHCRACALLEEIWNIVTTWIASLKDSCTCLPTSVHNVHPCWSHPYFNCLKVWRIASNLLNFTTNAHSFGSKYWLVGQHICTALLRTETYSLNFANPNNFNAPRKQTQVALLANKKQVKLSFTNYQPKKLLKTTTWGSNFLKKKNLKRKNEKNHKISKQF